ncbi:MAG: DUF362 domain-containing protein [Planctomycetota bacterium]|jgi:uncharacterized protein (DUF362 family)
MSHGDSRRQFLARAGVFAAGVAFSSSCDNSPASDRPASRPSSMIRGAPRVAIGRDDKLSRGKVAEHGRLLDKLLASAMQKVMQTADASAAWRGLFTPKDRIGIKVNTLGLSTQPAVVGAIVSGLRQAGIPAENIIIWDRFDVELAAAGFKLNTSSTGVKCRGTDAEPERYGSGYEPRIETSGEIGSCFSRVLTGMVDKLISVPVLKDHNLAGVSLGMKNFYGAIHNPNKYHDYNCDPYVVDVVGHRYIRPKWKLTVCDATRAQYHAGPTRHADYSWNFGGLVVSTDFVAADAVAADMLDKQRVMKKMKPLARDKRPTSHIATAAKRGFGVADLDKITRIEV